VKTKQETIQDYVMYINNWSELMNNYVEYGKYDDAREYAENILITIDKLRYIEKKFEI
jgi:hypothetical protein